MSPLPKVENGVPKAPKPATGFSAHAGKLKIKPNAAAPHGAQAYKPYQGYGGTPAPASTASSTQTSTHVQGSLLHWARGKHSY
jgi:hypothetical protein